MKITFLITSLNGGGAQGVCVNIINGLVEKGWDVTLIVLHLHKSVFHTRLNPRVNLVVLKVSNVRFAFFPLRKYFIENNLEKIVVFNYELTVLAVIIRFTIMKKFKIIARNINTLSQKKKLLKKKWEKYIVMPLIDRFYLKSDFIINQCEGMKEDLQLVFNKKHLKTGVIYNPVNKIMEIAKDKILKKENYILCIGRLEHQKAFHYAIEAFSKIINEFPNMKLKFLGEGSLSSDLKKLSINLGIEEKVVFLGFQKDIVPYYKKANLTLLTSLYEGFPNVLVESITLGTPVISFDCPSGPSEIIKSGKNGFLVNHLDKEDLVEKMRIALNTAFDIKLIHETSNRFRNSTVIEQYEDIIKNNNSKYY